MKVGDVVYNVIDQLEHIVHYVDPISRFVTGPEMTLECKPHFHWKANDDRIVLAPPTCLFCIAACEGPR